MLGHDGGGPLVEEVSREVVRHRVLERTSAPVETADRIGWKDTVGVLPDETVTVLAWFAPYAGKYVYIQRTTCSNPQASTCKWSHYKALKTTSSSRWKIKLPAYRQTNYFRAYIKPSSGYAPSYSNYYIETKRYRPATARVVR